MNLIFLILDRNFYIKKLKCNIKVLRVLSFDKYLSTIALYFYNVIYFNLVTVTGTNGKTSVVNFYNQINTILNFKTLSVGSLGILGTNHYFKNKKFFFTSFPIFYLYKFLDKLFLYSYKYLSMEGSSHGLQQCRIDNIYFDAAGFTNFSDEHLSYHKTIMLYFLSKLKLFSNVLKEGSYSLLNTNTDKYIYIHYVSKVNNIRVISYGHKSRDIKIIYINEFNAKVNIFGKIFILYYFSFGKFQLFNILCSIGLFIVKTYNIKEIISSIKKITFIRGRFELIMLMLYRIKIYIDYLHTPEALYNILSNIRRIYKNDIYIIFGCGGERDTKKRISMSEISSLISRYVVITNDNPRMEKPSKIIDQLLIYNGIEVKKRYKSIKYTMNSLIKSNILIVSGKGHEKYQIIHNKKIFSSDLLFVKIYDFITVTKNRVYFC